jgi:DNA invertase Pin-like site-specific DNA recombinase
MKLLHAARLSRLTDQSTGIDKQDEQATTYSAAYGHEIVATVADTDVSGSTDPKKRPKLGPYLTDPTLMVRYDGIIASALDRFGRNARHLTELRAWAEDSGKKLIVISPALQWPPADANDFASPIIWDLLGRLAEYELNAITKRARETQKWLKDNGYLVGRAPFGFLIVEKDNHKTLAPDPALVPVIHGMADRLIAGSTYTAIAAWLDSEGIPPMNGGRLWSQNSVRKALTNPALIGRRYDPDTGRVVLKFGPILDRDKWKLLQAAVAARATAPRRRSEAALLSGVIHCAKCGALMHRRDVYNVRKDGSKQYNHYYRCDGTNREPSRCGNMIPMDWADSQMASFITDLLGPVEIVELIAIPGSAHEDEIADVEADIRALDMDDPGYFDKHAALMAERQRLRELPAKEAELVEVATGVTVRQHWESLGTAEDRNDWLLEGKVNIAAAKEIFQVNLDVLLKGAHGGGWRLSGPSLAEIIRQTSGADGLKADA